MRRCSFPFLLFALSWLACGDDAATPADTADGDGEAISEIEVSPDTTDALDTVDTTPPDTLDAAEAETSPPEPTPICVAVRGNGELITAHFAALARLAELYGPFEGVAGGSSASITAFLTESMHMNPRLWQCGEVTCTRAEAGLRLALMYKSLFGYLDAMTERDEAVAIAAILDIVALAKEQGIGELVSGGKLQEAWTALVTLLESPDVADLVNDEVLGLLRDTPDLGYHVPDIWKGIQMLGAFDASDPAIFFRPGLVDFAGLAEKLGRIGSFYAGYGAFDAAGWEDFLSACSEAALGQSWAQTAAAVIGGRSCHERFRGLLDPWRAGFIPGEAAGQNRIRDRVGAHLRTLVVTSLLSGDAAARWQSARASYLAAQPLSFAPSFSDVGVGYWGAAAHTAAAVGNPLGFPDAKTARARTLGQATWYDALAASPAEPGLSRGVALDGLGVSAGGWPDLAPVLALRNAGCDKVVYVTRRGGESVFAQGIATLLGMDEATRLQLFDLGTPTSAFNRSLEEAAAVWCTDWNAFTAFDLAGIVSDAYGAPLEVHDTSLVALRDYGNRSNRLGVAGCTPGVVPTP